MSKMIRAVQAALYHSMTREMDGIYQKRKGAYLMNTNKSLKRLLAIILSITMTFGMMPALAFSAEDGDTIISSTITAFVPLDRLTQTQYWSVGTYASELLLPTTLSVMVTVTTTVTSGSAIEINEVILGDMDELDEESNDDDFAIDDLFELYENDSGSDGNENAGGPLNTIITLHGEDIAVLGWQSEPEYDPDTEGIYAFTPMIDLPEGYILEEGVKPPQITVTLAPRIGIMAMAATEGTLPLFYNELDGTLRYSNKTNGEIVDTSLGWSGSGSTLTLTDFNYTLTTTGTSQTVLTLPANTTLEIKGDNSIVGAGSSSSTAYGINAGAGLVVKGSGTLTVKARESTSNNSYGLLVGGSLTMESGTLDLTGSRCGSSGWFSRGLHMSSSGSNLNMVGGTIYTKSTSPSGNRSAAYVVAIKGDVEIKGYDGSDYTIDTSFTAPGTFTPATINVKISVKERSLYFNNSDGTLRYFSTNGEVAVNLLGWSGNGNTLMLNGFNFSTPAETALTLPPDTTLIITGTNAVRSIYDGDNTAYGINALGNMTIQGGGTLTAVGGNGLSGYGMNIGDNFNFEMTNGAIYATGNTKAIQISGSISGSCVTDGTEKDTIITRKESVPDAAIDYVNERLTGLVTSWKYTVNGTEYTADESGNIQIPSASGWIGTTVSLVKKGFLPIGDSGVQTLSLPSRAIAPNPEKMDTTYGQSNGEISNVDSTMEYRRQTGVSSFSVWTAITGSSVTGLAGLTSGYVYQVRYKAVEGVSFASDTASVMIAVSTAPSDLTLYYNEIDGTLRYTNKTTGAIANDLNGWSGYGSTLMFTNFTYITSATTALNLPAGTTLVIIGDNKVIGTGSNASFSYGINAGAGLTVQGSGSLYVESGTATGNNNSFGLNVSGNLTMESGVLKIVGGTAPSNWISRGLNVASLSMFAGTIYAKAGASRQAVYVDGNVVGDIEIRGVDNGNYTADAIFSGKIIVKKGMSDVVSDTKLWVEDRTLYYNDTDNSLHYEAIDGEIVIDYSGWSGSSDTLTLNGFNYVTKSASALVMPNGATLEVTGASTIKSTYDGEEQSYGVNALGRLTLQGGGTLTAVGGTGSNGYGLNVLGDFNLDMSGGSFYAKGTANAVQISGAINELVAVSGNNGSGSYTFEGEFTGNPKTATVKNGGGSIIDARLLMKEVVPNASIDFVNERLTGLAASAGFTINGTSFTTNASGNINIMADWLGTTLSIVKKGGANTSDSDPQSLPIPQRSTAPSPGKKDTTGGNNDGEITGVNNTMEYRVNGAVTWIGITGGVVTGLTAGTYEVRIKATASEFASEAANIIIASSKSPENRTLFYRYDGKLYDAQTGGNAITDLTGWSGSGNTLTLTDFNYSTYANIALAMPVGATLVINGVNTLESTYNGTANTFGVYAFGTQETSTTLTISGNGTLNATGGTSTTWSGGIYAVDALLIDSGTIYAIGGSSSNISFGLFAYGFTINGGSIYATGRNGNYSYGFYSALTVNMNGGSLTAAGSKGVTRSYGVFIDGTYGAAFNMNGGTVDATCGSGANGYGLYSNSFNMKSGIVNAIGGNDANSVGLCASSFTASNMTVGSAIHANGNENSVVVRSGTVPSSGLDVKGKDAGGLYTIDGAFAIYNTNQRNIVATNDNAVLRDVLITVADSRTLYYRTDGKLYDAQTGGNAVTNLTGWSGSGNELTLTNFNFTTSATTALVMSTNTSLILNGVNTIKSTFSGSGSSYGISVNTGGVGVMTVQGNGVLYVSSGNGSSLNRGIDVSTGGLAINSGTVYAAGGNGGTVSYGVYVAVDLIIDGGELNAAGGNSASSYGLFASNLIMSNGAINATGGTANGSDTNDRSSGCYVTNNFNITDGIINATGGNSSKASYGLRANRFFVNGGEITAIAATATANSYGIYAPIDFSMTSGIVCAMGESNAAAVVSTVTISADIDIKGKNSGGTYTVGAEFSTSGSPKVIVTSDGGQAVKDAMLSRFDGYALYYRTDGKLYDAQTGGSEVTGLRGWSGSGSTLTLTNFNFTTNAPIALVLPNGVTLILNGTNMIKSIYSGTSMARGLRSGTTVTSGIYAEGDLHVKGGGTLNVVAGSSGTGGTSYGLNVVGNFSMAGGVINATGETGSAIVGGAINGVKNDTTSSGDDSVIVGSTITPENRTLYFNANGKLYSDPIFQNEETGMSGYSYNNGVFTLENFTFITQADIAIEFPYNENIILEIKGVNTVQSTYSGIKPTFGIKAANTNPTTGSVLRDGSNTGSFTIQGDGTLNANGGTSTAQCSDGICVGNTFDIRSGIINATGGNAFTSSYGAYADGDFVMNGGTLCATSNGSSIGSLGLRTNDFTMNSGRVYATNNNTNGSTNRGISVNGNFSMTGGRVYAKSAAAYAFYVYNNVTLHQNADVKGSTGNDFTDAAYTVEGKFASIASQAIVRKDNNGIMLNTRILIPRLTLTVNKDDAAWSSHGKTFHAKQGATDVTGSVNGNTVTFDVPIGVYSIYDGTTDTEVSAQVTDENSATKVDYYTLTLNAGTGIDSVSGGGVYLVDDTATISATVASNYTWGSWSDNASSLLALPTDKDSIIAVDQTITLTANAVSQKLGNYIVTITVYKDSALWSDGSAPAITLMPNGGATITDLNDVPNGTYKIYAGGADTGKTITVNGAGASERLDYYTVEYRVIDAGTASGSTISVTYGGAAISSGAVVLSGKNLIITAVGNGASSYTYLWSGAGTNSETTTSFIVNSLAKKIDATCTVTGSVVAPVIISFDPNGGTGSKPSENVTKGSSFTLPANPFERGGYTFIGWKIGNTDSTLSVNTSITVNGDITLYAQWRNNSTSNETGGNNSESNNNKDSGNGNISLPSDDGESVFHPDSDVSSLLITEEHIAYMVGRPNSMFAPNDNMTRAEVAQMFYNLLRDKNVGITKNFPDIEYDVWYAKAVNTLASIGMIVGYDDGLYHPQDNLTRAQLAALVVRFAKTNRGDVQLANDDQVKAIFNDVSETSWAYQSINTAASFGWVNGVGGGRFEPDRYITRAEVSTLMNNVLRRYPDKVYIDKHSKLNFFDDVDKRHWAYYNIMETTVSHSYKQNDKNENWESHVDIPITSQTNKPLSPVAIEPRKENENEQEANGGN